MADKNLGKTKFLQVEEEKVLTEQKTSVMVQIMSLNGKKDRWGYGMPQ
jgi:hypothetical protein